MKKISIFLLACILLAGWQCASTSYQTDANRFSFTYNNQLYSILSLGVTPGPAANYLLLRVDDVLLLRARDNNLDGTLDTLLVGDLTLEQANAIYEQGIKQALQEGKFQRPQTSRVYHQRIAEDLYIIQSFEASSEKWFNKFVLQNTRNKAEIVFFDREADGKLDEVEKGAGDMRASQPLYQRILDEGVEAGYIVKRKGTYIVQPPT